MNHILYLSRYSAVPAALSFILLIATPAMAAGDATAGKKAFAQCQMCHTVDATGRNGIGPNLAGIVGSKAGAKPGYIYSAALKKSAIAWNAKSLDAWLTKPAAFVPGTKMAYAGMSDAKARENVIAYLGTLKAK